MWVFGLTIAGVIYALPFDKFTSQRDCEAAVNNVHWILGRTVDYEMTCSHDGQVQYRLQYVAPKTER